MTNSIDDILANLFAAIENADYGTEGNGQGYDVKVYGVPELKELLKNLGLIAPESSVYTLADVHAAVAGFYYNASSNFATLQADILTTIEALIVENSPVIDGGDTAAFSVDENTTDVATIAASDAQGDALTYTLSGADAFLFQIDQFGALSFRDAPDFEAPGDVGGDNVYDVTVTVSDGAQIDSQGISVTVADVGEATPGLTLVFEDLYSLGITNAVSGSAGDDTISFGFGVAAISGNLSVDGGAGGDTISFGDSAAVIDGSVSVYGGGGGDTISFGNSAARSGGDVSVYGGGDSDTISFGFYAASASGQVSVDGGAGDDTIGFGDEAAAIDGSVSVYGGAGGDTISFGNSAARSGGDVSIDGGAGSDTISFGDDAAYGYSHVSADGGADSDTISFGANAGAFGHVSANGGGGSDTISFGANAGAFGGQITVDLGFEDGAADELIFLGTVENATIQNWTAGEDALVDIVDPLEWTGVDNGTDTVFTAGSQSLAFEGVTGLGVDVDDFLF